MSDAYSPLLLTVDADGRVGADFAGHVHAAGLDLDAGDGATPPVDRRIRWLRESDGAVVASIFGSDLGAGGQGLWLEAGDAILLTTRNVPEESRILLATGGISDFLQVDVSKGAITEGADPNETWRSIGAGGQPAFKNNWVNFDADGGRPAQFFEDQLGIVHLRGLIKNGTMATPAFTLPAGYRPLFTSPATDNVLHIAVASNSLFGMVIVAENGAVQPWVGSNAWFDLSSIHFRAEQ